MHTLSPSCLVSVGCSTNIFLDFPGNHSSLEHSSFQFASLRGALLPGISFEDINVQYFMENSIIMAILLTVTTDIYKRFNFCFFYPIQLNRATIQDPNTGELRVADYRISKRFVTLLCSLFFFCVQLFPRYSCYE